MRDLKNRIFELIDAGSSQAKSLIESFNDVVESIDFNAQIDFFKEKRKELVKRGNELFGDFAELLKQVKESFTDFSVTVPFDETIGEEITYEAKDGKLLIEVSYSDETSERSNKTSVLIPSNCDLGLMYLTTNKTAKTATVVIPKVVAETPKEDENEKPIEVKPKKKVVKRKAVRKSENESVEESVEESAPHITSKLAQKIKQNGAKYSQMMHRDSSGRFVRRTPEEN